MKGISLKTDETKLNLSATVEPDLIEGELTQEKLTSYLQESDFAGFYPLTNAIISLCERVQQATDLNDNQAIVKVIAEVRDATIKVDMSEDKMQAHLIVTSPYTGKVPNLKNVLSLLRKEGITRGVSNKRIKNLLLQAKDADCGVDFKGLIAKGLAAKQGKDSYVKPLLPNALERVLQPQEREDGKVNMRDFGEILCCDADTPVARRIKPTLGRSGFTITGEKLAANKGEWKSFKTGDNTYISDKDENLMLAAVSGQPKFMNDVMSIDDTFHTQGVNIGTGNINYDGAVIVTGDVTESMEIIAKGDVTVTGFVESAIIRSGGDIIISEGALGKMHEEDCILDAAGSIYIQHGQGLDITAGKNIQAKKQLAYSRIYCKGKIIVGEQDNPLGSIFASNIRCYSTILAGTVGAVSGSALTIDFSEGINILQERRDTQISMLKELKKNNLAHQKTLKKLNKKTLSENLQERLSKANVVYESETQLLQWLKNLIAESDKELKEYELSAKVLANEDFHKGVTVKMNSNVWRSEKDEKKATVALVEGKWALSIV